MSRSVGENGEVRGRSERVNDDGVAKRVSESGVEGRKDRRRPNRG